MKMLEDCIDFISFREDISNDVNTKDYFKSIYYHLNDYKDLLNKSIELSNEISLLTDRWELVNYSVEDEKK